MNLQDAEVQALKDVGVLIKYAAASATKIPESIATPIVNAWKAQEDKTWDADISIKFWTAYSELSDLLKPVNLDTITTAEPAPSRRWILFGDFIQRTLAQRKAVKYLCFLIIMLILAILLGLLQSVSTTLNLRAYNLLGQGNDAAEKIATLKTETPNKQTELNKNKQELANIDEELINNLNGIDFILRIFYSAPHFTNEADFSSGVHDDETVQHYYKTREKARAYLVNFFILQKVFESIVPALFGLIGAFAYVLRLISRQISETSFSKTSPVRHSVRLCVGAVSGFAVSLGDFYNAQLSAAALAFMAGYAVEPVFATMDTFAEKFRRT